MVFQGAYKTIRKIISAFVLQIMHNVMKGQPIPTQWAEAVIIHIRKKAISKNVPTTDRYA